jgi:predicted CoA-substrate-specific enzyme activase
MVNVMSNQELIKLNTEGRNVNHIGIDIGNSRIKIVVLDDNLKINFTHAEFHKGKIKDIILQGLTCLPSDTLYSIGITGSFPDHSLTSFSVGRESDMIIKGTALLYPQAASVLDVGAERSLFITGLNSTLSIRSTSGCSSGTGSFFEEQMNRLDLSFQDLPGTQDVGRVPRIAGRCTVFARTDIIHRQQEGYTVSEILRGLAEAVAVSLKSGLLKGDTPDSPFLLSGGMSLNHLFVAALGKVLKMDDIIVLETSPFTGAIGAALAGKEKNDPLTLKDFQQVVLSASHPNMGKSGDPPLGEDAESSSGITLPKKSSDLKYPLHLGIDVGSTSTNLVLIDSTGQIVDTLYLRTDGAPGKTVLEGVQKLQSLYEFSADTACVTGSGRRLGASVVQSTLIRDEITAQSRGGSFLYPGADTIFEIGGQDSKFMRLQEGRVTSFRMNRSCAAGTGAFLEEQAIRLGILIEQFGTLAIKSEAPACLDERCTVFMETLVVRQLAEGRSREDIAAGLCYAVVRNYLQRVVGDEEIGEQILLQGGIAHNQGVVRAFRNITGKEILVPPYFDVTGALGAALIAMDIQTANVQKMDAPVQKETNYLSAYEKSLLKNYSPPEGNDPPVIGIPRVLFIHKMFPLFHSFFRSLGFQVLLSGPSDEDIVSRSGQVGQEETCYPVKLVNGHISWLLEKGIDYLFLPSLLTMRHEGSNVRKDYACLFMQSLPLMMDKNFNFAKSGVTLLAPSLSLDLGKKEILKALVQTGKKLGKTRGAILKATAKGIAAFLFFLKELKIQGKAAIKQLQPGKPAFVVVTRPYGLLDPELNKGIPDYLRHMGYTVLTISHLPVESYGVEGHTNLYWPFGQHILAGVEIIRKTPGLFLVYLTNHGCGPDTVLLHYVREKMKGEPFLHLEVDEHASTEGIKTRLEAFIRSERVMIDQGPSDKGAIHSRFPQAAERSLFFLAPPFYPLMDIISSVFSIQIETLPVKQASRWEEAPAKQKNLLCFRAYGHPSIPL